MTLISSNRGLVPHKFGGGGRGKTIEMWRWWRENNRNEEEEGKMGIKKIEKGE